MCDSSVSSPVNINQMVEEIRIKNFDYPLPDEFIARHPLAERDRCKLLLSRPDGKLSDRVFRELPALLPPSALLVCNNTKVINARIEFHKSTGSRVEVFLLEPLSPEDYILAFQSKKTVTWKCMIGNLKRWKEGVLEKRLDISGRGVVLYARRGLALEGNSHEVELSWDDDSLTFADIVDAAGYLPIPPYLRRATEKSDLTDYQTVYSRIKGSVAAPTAGLHFTPEVMDDLRSHNIEIRELTLHVGAGTFQPVKSETIGEHPMHTESFVVERATVEAVLKGKEEGRKIVAVGTTTVRTLESLPFVGIALARGEEDVVVGQWEAYTPEGLGIDTEAALRLIIAEMDKRGQDSLVASTAIMIAPGFKWRIVDCMVTNFHQPQSTLLLLVSSFLEKERGVVPDAAGDGLQWKKIYRHALESDFRFLSYGDACLLFPLKMES